MTKQCTLSPIQSAEVLYNLWMQRGYTDGMVRNRKAFPPLDYPVFAGFYQMGWKRAEKERGSMMTAKEARELIDEAAKTGARSLRKKVKELLVSSGRSKMCGDEHEVILCESTGRLKFNQIGFWD